MSKELQHTMFGMREHHDVTSLLSLSLLDVSDPLFAFSFGLAATRQATGRLPLQRVPGRCQAMYAERRLFFWGAATMARATLERRCFGEAKRCKANGFGLHFPRPITAFLSSTWITFFRRALWITIFLLRNTLLNAVSQKGCVYIYQYLYPNFPYV